MSKSHFACVTSFIASIAFFTTSAMAALLPFDVTVSAGDPSEFTVVNPFGGTINPVEKITVVADGLFSDPPPGTLPLSVVLSSKLNPDGHEIGVMDVYLDSTSPLAVGNYQLSLFLTFASPPAFGQFVAAVATGSTPTVQSGFVTVSYPSPAPGEIRHDFVARIQPESNLFFKGPALIAQPSPGTLHAFYKIGTAVPDVIFDPSKPIASIEMTVTGVPEPSTVALAAVGMLALAGVAGRRAYHKRSDR